MLLSSPAKLSPSLHASYIVIIHQLWALAAFLTGTSLTSPTSSCPPITHSYCIVYSQSLLLRCNFTFSDTFTVLTAAFHT